MTASHEPGEGVYTGTAVEVHGITKQLELDPEAPYILFVQVGQLLRRAYAVHAVRTERINERVAAIHGLDSDGQIRVSLECGTFPWEVVHRDLIRFEEVSFDIPAAKPKREEVLHPGQYV